MDDPFQILERVLELLNKYGVPLAIVGIIIAFVVKYGPGLVSANRSFLETSQETQRRLTASIEAQEQIQVTHLMATQAHAKQFRESHEVACRCGHHVCDVLEHVAEKLEIQDRVEDSVIAIRRELERVKAGV